MPKNQFIIEFEEYVTEDTLRQALKILKPRAIEKVDRKWLRFYGSGYVVNVLMQNYDPVTIFKSITPQVLDKIANDLGYLINDYIEDNNVVPDDERIEQMVLQIASSYAL